MSEAFACGTDQALVAAPQAAELAAVTVRASRGLSHDFNGRLPSSAANRAAPGLIEQHHGQERQQRHQHAGLP